jgi:hypothetical protein
VGKIKKDVTKNVYKDVLQGFDNKNFIETPGASNIKKHPT